MLVKSQRILKSKLKTILQSNHSSELTEFAYSIGALVESKDEETEENE